MNPPTPDASSLDGPVKPSSALPDPESDGVPTIDAAPAGEAADPHDPKELMREALERKKQARHHDSTGLAGGSRLPGGAHRQAGSRRQFRRKSGG